MENQHQGSVNRPGDVADTHRGRAARDDGPSPTAERQSGNADAPRQIRAAGGVLWRTGLSGAVEVAGIYRPGNDNWSLPKGKLDNGEHRLVGACREVEEETGLRPLPQTYLTRAQYQLSRPGGAVTKTVDFWSMRALNPNGAFIPSDEVTGQRWLGLEEAFSTLDRPRDQQALRRFTQLPLITATVVLLRHTQAQSPASFRGIDVARPLDARGRGQAAQLVPVLALYNPRRIISATPQRCVKTVAPLAAATGLPVDGEELFDEESHLRNPERTVARLRELAASHATTVVCTHAPVIADALAILTDSDGIELTSVHTPVGGVWVLSFTHKTLAAIERLD